MKEGRAKSSVSSGLSLCSLCPLHPYWVLPVAPSPTVTSSHSQADGLATEPIHSALNPFCSFGGLTHSRGENLEVCAHSQTSDSEYSGTMNVLSRARFRGSSRVKTSSHKNSRPSLPFCCHKPRVGLSLFGAALCGLVNTSCHQGLFEVSFLLPIPS